MNQRAVAAAVGAVLVSWLAPPPVRAVDVPTNFVVENAVPGATFDTPVGVAFLPNGNMLVAEKRGMVWVVQSGTKLATPMWSRTNEVLDVGDKGLLGIAVDPNYSVNRFVYFLYTVDPDSNGIDDNDDAFGRLARYQTQLGNGNVVDASTRTILLGRVWNEGPTIGSITHTIGSLRFGTDGSLLISAGEGAQYSNVDAGGRDPDMFGPGKADPFEDIGAFRAQYIGSLAGKILRIDPLTGLGYPSNPFWDGDPSSVRSRVWAYGLRNPFRFNVRPGSGAIDPAAGDPGSLYIGDVGWETWEDFNIATGPGRNFGWPCYEGKHFNTDYQNASPAHHGCGTIGTPANPSPYTPPVADWHHSNAGLSQPPGFWGNASIGGVFYTGTSYPAGYQGRYFFGDFGGQWIRVATVDGSDNVVSIAGFGNTMDGPVDFALEPGTGNLIYVAINVNQVRRIRYGGGPGGNNPPIAIANGSPSAGVVPLAVAFSSAGSNDPDGDTFTTTWTFGDGTGSFLPNPPHTYDLPGTYHAALSVDDGHGGIGTDTVIVVVTETATFPTTPVLDAFDRANGPLAGPWIDPVYLLNGLAVDDSMLSQSCCSYAAPVWGGATFGPDQEAFVRLQAVSPTAPEHDLMLKIQGTSYAASHLEVRYDAAQEYVQIGSYTPSTSWINIGSPIAASFSPGDQLGARAYQNGTIDVFKNGVLIGSRSAAAWPFAASGGRIGLTIDGAYASRLDDFGGGDVVVSSNTAPNAIITQPADGSFYAVGDSVRLRGTANDAQQPAAALGYQWAVSLRHNNHTHPSTFVATGSAAAFKVDAHEDGTGVHLLVDLRVTDAGGLADTTRVEIFPDVDLEPAALAVDPASPDTSSTADYTFVLHNRGRMPSQASRWRLVADDSLLAEGDTTVAAVDSVIVTRTLPTRLPVGSYTLRVVADTLGAVVETDETNNAAIQSLDVIPGGGTVGAGPLGPRVVALSYARPNPSPGAVGFALDLPAAERVEFRVFDVQGREVWSQAPRTMNAGRWRLEWSGRTRGGQRAASGVYLARVQVGGHNLQRRFALIR